MDETDQHVHRQGKISSEEEQMAAKKLMEEAERHGDIHFIPMVDTYQSLPGKTLSILEYGLYYGARFLIKNDDDVCPLFETILPLANSSIYDNDKEKMLYSGIYYWKGTEYKSMAGADGMAGPYWSGPLYLLSRNLAHHIVWTCNAYTYNYAAYGSSSEDVDMGKWVSHIKYVFPNSTIDYKEIHGHVDVKVNGR